VAKVTTTDNTTKKCLPFHSYSRLDQAGITKVSHKGNLSELLDKTLKEF